MRIPARCVSVVLVVLLGACAGGGGGHGLALATPAPEQRCSESVPIDTVAPAELFDEGAILTAVPADRASDSLVAVFSFSVDSTATLAEPRLIGGEMTAEEAAQLQVAMSNAYNGWALEERAFRARLRVEGGEQPRLSLHTPEHCPPEMTFRSRRRAGQHLQTLVDEVDLPTTVVLRLFADDSGRVTEVNLQFSPGNVSVNESVMAFAETLRFHPALRDGAPVPVWVEVPFTIRPRRR
jgi:TonB family protein